MRKEAALEQWKALYEIATRIKVLEPWKKFYDIDVFAVCEGNEEDTTFYSILGHYGDCYGIAVYEGYEGFNDFLMLTMADRLNLSTEFVMFSQKNLTCYWGDRNELTEAQRKTIKEIGYKYRGKNQWLYFMSFEPGYYPYNLNQDEVIRMTKHLKNLELALHSYEKENIEVDFESGEMFCLEYNNDKQTWSCCAKPLPFTGYHFNSVLVIDDDVLDDLSQVPQTNAILEIDLMILGARVKDKKYDKPINPTACLIADAKMGMMLGSEILEPEMDPFVAITEQFIGFIFQHGAPKEIRVSNDLVAACLEEVCGTCNIDLVRVDSLQAIVEFQETMRYFM